MSVSISPTICSASWLCPWMNSQRGLSGTLRRTRRTKIPKSAPMPNARRHPMSAGKFEVSRRSRAPPAPAADASAGKESGQKEVPRCEGECRRNGRGQIDREGQDEQVAPSESIGQVAKEQRAQACSGDVERGGGADVGGRECDSAAVLSEARRHIADHRDLEAVQYPDPAESDDDAPVKSRPRQSIQTRGNAGRDRS